MACRSCETALRCHGIPVTGLANLAPKRSFSRSTRHLKPGGFPTFGQTSSPELDSVLSSLRYKVFLPHGYLNKDQHKLVFREEFRSQLENQPVKISIGDEDVELEHFNQHNLPKTWGLTKKVFELLGQSWQAKDWYTVVPTLLRGFQDVGFGMNPAKMEKLVRVANNAGRQDVVIRSIQQVKSTNLSLQYPGVRYEVLWGIHANAQDRGPENWSEKTTRQSINWMKQLAILLEDEIHGGGHLSRMHDPRISPAVLGLLLELNAISVYRHAEGTDAESNVKTYATRLMDVLPLWEQDDFADAPSDSRNNVFQVILWQALNVAQKILGADMPQAEVAEKKKIALEEQIQQTLKSDTSAIKPQYNLLRMRNVWDKRIQ
ncbi:MAG: hypothetical protein M1821_005752 [Bathelium mastoideum]|nr:MAG: hypothetical protein M1821_005752 [Bathelium mastoideum]